MSSERELHNRVRAFRAAHGWSQEELASRADVSRAEVSAIETDRLTPSAAAALNIAAAFGCHVEDVFSVIPSGPAETRWAWGPSRQPCRYWKARLEQRTLAYPVEVLELGQIAHDGLFAGGRFEDGEQTGPAETLVLASCDPAVGVLASELQRSSGVRLLAFQRSSREALSLLAHGLVHVAGIHLAEKSRPDQNVLAAREALQGGVTLLRVAQWQEGLSLTPGLRVRSLRGALRARLRWVGREKGSAARELLDKLLGHRPTPRRTASGHRAVAEAVRSGWADVGVCLRLTSEEAGLDFVGVREEQYDLCYPTALGGDPRIRALVEVVRSRTLRRLLSELPGYGTLETGQLQQCSGITETIAIDA